MYGYKKESRYGFQETLSKVREELKKEGFGVLSEIDVKDTLKKKLDVDYENYVIMGACNPPFAYKALQAEKDIGLLLPCNIIVYSLGDKVLVSAIRPTEAMKAVGNLELKDIASQVEEKLKRAIDNVAEKQANYMCCNV